MNIQVNGEAMAVAVGCTMATLLDAMGVDVRSVVVERNGEIYGMADFAGAVLQENDKLEIVHFIGGG